jgi:hypothetical protein
VVPLLESFYGVTDIRDKSQVEDTQIRYFQILTTVMDRVHYEEALKMVAYFLIIVSIVRLIGYMSVHPRIAVLSQTLYSAMDNIFHFSLVFCFICGLLAWLACWSFGPDKDLFCTLNYALLTQLKMVMGEFPFDDPWKETFLERVWYVWYAVLVFFLGVNIFLAIIVEAFVLVKQRLSEQVLVERSIIVDFIALLRYRLLGHWLNWPSHLAVARHLHTTRHFNGPVNSKELRTSKFLTFHSRLEAQEYLDFYYGLLGEVILAKPGQDFVRLRHQLQETQRCLVVLFGVPESKIEDSARKIQRVWLKYYQRRRLTQLLAPSPAQARSPFVAMRSRATSRSMRDLTQICEGFHSEEVFTNRSVDNMEIDVMRSQTLPSLLSNGANSKSRSISDVLERHREVSVGYGIGTTEV